MTISITTEHGRVYYDVRLPHGQYYDADHADRCMIAARRIAERHPDIGDHRPMDYPVRYTASLGEVRPHGQNADGTIRSWAAPVQAQYGTEPRPVTIGMAYFRGDPETLYVYHISWSQ